MIKKFITISILILAVTANILTAESKQDIEDFKGKYKDSVISLLFHDKKDTGLFTLFGLFAKEPTDSEFEQRMAEHTHMLKVDTSNPDLAPLKDEYNVPELPYMVVYNKNKEAFKEKPSIDTEKKILELVK